MLTVYAEDRLVGEIHESRDGPGFVYHDAWLPEHGAFPVSVTMPLAGRAVPADHFLLWASNLLPEGEQLGFIGQSLGVARGDVLGLLEAIGRDTAGALSFGAPGLTDSVAWRPIAAAAELERILEELPRKPFLAGEDGVSMSLAGVQTKLAVARDTDGQLYIPLDGAPSTHILKPDSDRLIGSVQNEAFCLSLARRCRLHVPDVTTGVAGARAYLLIARYDRAHTAGRWHRWHQEDFCQILGKPASAKYERNRSGIAGPTLADMIAAVRRHGLAPDVLNLLDAALFSILACNTDAHAKNYSMILRGPGRPQMAPLYDVMCAEPYDQITRNLAQTIAGKNRGEHLRRRHWLRFAAEAGLGPSLLLRRIDALARRMLDTIGDALNDVAAMPAGDHPILPAVADAVTRRCRAVREGLADMQSVDID